MHPEVGLAPWRVTRISRRLAFVAFCNPSSDSMRLRVRALTPHFSAMISNDHPNAARAIRICSIVKVDITFFMSYFRPYGRLLK